MKIFAKITLAVEFLDHAQMAGIVKKIVNNFDNKWMGILFHEFNFIENCLSSSLIQEIDRAHRPFNSEF